MCTYMYACYSFDVLHSCIVIAKLKCTSIYHDLCMYATVAKQVSACIQVYIWKKFLMSTTNLKELRWTHIQ